jgi:hypothetical protein
VGWNVRVRGRLPCDSVGTVLFAYASIISRRYYKSNSKTEAPTKSLRHKPRETPTKPPTTSPAPGFSSRSTRWTPNGRDLRNAAPLPVPGAAPFRS